jgi:hypothetical protein
MLVKGESVLFLFCVCRRTRMLITNLIMVPILQKCHIYPFADPTYQLRCLILPYRPFFVIDMEDLRQTQIE